MEAPRCWSVSLVSPVVRGRRTVKLKGLVSSPKGQVLAAAVVAGTGSSKVGAQLACAVSKVVQDGLAQVVSNTGQASFANDLELELVAVIGASLAAIIEGAKLVIVAGVGVLRLGSRAGAVSVVKVAARLYPGAPGNANGLELQDGGARVGTVEPQGSLR